MAKDWEPPANLSARSVHVPSDQGAASLLRFESSNTQRTCINHQPAGGGGGVGGGGSASKQRDDAQAQGGGRGEIHQLSSDRLFFGI